MPHTRRDFLKSATAASLGFAGLHTLFARGSYAQPQLVPGFGPLRPDPAGLLDLPEGFVYKVISRMGNAMSDGFLVPGRADGMAAFAGPEGRTIVVRNHENDLPEHGSAFGLNHELLAKARPEWFYDYGGGKKVGEGGTTTLLFNTQTGEVEREWLSLTGTLRNCAGGPTPWGSWITCEETTQRAEEDGYEQDHGWCFEVPATAEAGLAKPEPIRGMGRFNHEAIAVDPKSGCVYLTEDRHDGLLYRFVPEKPGDLRAGGKLQALMVRERKQLDTRNWAERGHIHVGDALPVAWIDLDEIDAPNDDLRFRGYTAGAARFARGEGMWTAADGVIYFACTNGGKAEAGQIFKYTPSPVEGTPGEDSQPAQLTLFVEPNDKGIIDNADNLTVAPWGDLIVCEDGSGEQFLVGITPAGGLYKFARNASPSNSEFAGATFSPDGSTLFVNIQVDGLTLAINGPWASARV